MYDASRSATSAGVNDSVRGRGGRGGRESNGDTGSTVCTGATAWELEGPKCNDSIVGVGDIEGIGNKEKIECNLDIGGEGGKEVMRINGNGNEVDTGSLDDVGGTPSEVGTCSSLRLYPKNKVSR